MALPSFELSDGITIKQDRHVMKVGSDALLLAAWIDSSYGKVLDVGCGCGVIGLCLLKDKKAKELFAIDISEAAIQLATTNFLENGFGSKVTLDNRALESYSEKTTIQESFDLVVSNPPYHMEDVRSPDANRHSWRHVEALSMEDILSSARRLLKPKGRLAVILAMPAAEQLKERAKDHGFNIKRLTHVRPKDGREPNRCLIECIREEAGTPVWPSQNHITMRNADGSYHEDYVALAGHLHDRRI